MNISGEGKPTTTLGSPFQSYRSKEAFSLVHVDHLVFQFVPVAICFIAAQHWKVSGSIHLAPSL